MLGDACFHPTAMITALALTLDGDVFGSPVGSLRDVPAGEYTVQAVLHLYETFHVAHGHTLKLPMDRGEGQHRNRAPGSRRQPVRI